MNFNDDFSSFSSSSTDYKNDYNHFQNTKYSSQMIKSD